MIETITWPAAFMFVDLAFILFMMFIGWIPLTAWEEAFNTKWSKRK